jgi:hypothetical protein
MAREQAMFAVFHCRYGVENQRLKKQALCLDIEFRVLRYPCFLSDLAWAAAAPTLYWTQIAVCTLHCESMIARGSCAARAALSRRSGGCTQRRGRAGRTGRSTGRAAGAAL